MSPTMTAIGGSSSDSSTATASSVAAALATTATATTTATTTVAASVAAVCVVGAATTALGLVVLQSDWVSRRLLLSPERLTVKRWSAYQYAWNQAFQTQVTRYYQALGSHDNNNTNNSNTNNNNGSGRAHQFLSQSTAAAAAADPTELLTTPQEIQELMERMLTTKELAGLRVARIGRDELQHPHSPTSQEYFVWLLQEKKNSTDGTVVVSIQVPLVAFGVALADRMERTISPVTFCFVADAAGGLASQCIVDLLRATKLDRTVVHCVTANNSNSNNNPLSWMIQWALLSEQPGVYSRTKLLRCLYAFCRLEAVSILAKARDDNHRTTKQQELKTILFTVPTAVVPILLPALHQVFPDDRHVFAYTGCVQTVAVLEAKRRNNNHNNNNHNHNRNNHTASACALDGAWQFDQPRLVSATPVSAVLPRSVHVMERSYAQALADLPAHLAAVTECWMAAVDAYLCRKLETTNVADYLPYVCKLDYLLAIPNNSSNSSDQTPPVAIPVGSTRYWSVRSLLQYITGSASRELSTETLDAATAWLSGDGTPTLLSLHHAYQTQIENAVFSHKLILLANKTLVDTVSPAQHWTLKQAVKRGCACCAPEEEEEEDLPKPENSAATDSVRTAGTQQRSNKKRGYLDGKAGFAFDPSQFA